MWIEDSNNYSDEMEKGFPNFLGLSIIFILYSLWVSFEVASLVLTWCYLSLRKSLRRFHPKHERVSPYISSSCVLPWHPGRRVYVDWMCYWSYVCDLPSVYTQHTHGCMYCTSWEKRCSVWSGLPSDETIALRWDVLHANITTFLCWKFEEGQKFFSCAEIVWS